MTVSSSLLAFIQICKRCPRWPSMQGTTTNGTHLLPFKTGAFLAGAPVQPVILKYGEVSISFWLLASAALSCCSKSEGNSCTETLELTLDGHVWQGSVSPAWESISAPQHLFLLLANVCHSVTVYEVCALAPACDRWLH